MMIASVSCIITALLCLMGVVAIRKWVVQPLKSLIQCFSRLATGDIGQINVAADRGDEIGDLGRTYEGFRQFVLDTHAARDRAREQEEVVESERSRAGMEKARLDEV